MPKNQLHIDVETFSSVDLKTSGVYKYCESVDFEILIICYALNGEDISTIDLASGEKMHSQFIALLHDPSIEKHAHNAAFERNCFKAIGYDIPIEQWHCSAVKTAYCGLPLSLAGASEALKLREQGKLNTGKALIRYFSINCKPTKVNGGRMRNLPQHDKEKWQNYKIYCAYDVIAERQIAALLEDYHIPPFEREMYILDQEINDRGILIDLAMAQNACILDERHAIRLKNRMLELTGLRNPNSPAQLKKWLKEQTGEEINSLGKDLIPELIAKSKNDTVKEVLELRAKSSKTSTKKYIAMLNCACDDSRAHGLFQFYGANRTGRWAGRLIQLQNLRRNYLKDLSGARQLFAEGDYDTVSESYSDVSDTLSQLIRTAFVAPKDHLFCVADFSAIEARVIAWLADEKWRLDVFNTHGKLYEASASMMFNVPIEQIDKGSDLRSKGKVAELALGYQGSVGALKAMGADSMGLSESDMALIVTKWRNASSNIVALWGRIEAHAIAAVKRRSKVVLHAHRGLVFNYDGTALTITLPSGRKLFYWNAKLARNKFDRISVKYMGNDRNTGQWTWVETYGGKFVENVVQAIARDLLADSMLRLRDAGFNIVMHVHDEAVCEVPIGKENQELEKMCDIMGQEVSWAKGLPLGADGYITPFYKKD